MLNTVTGLKSILPTLPEVLISEVNNYLVETDAKDNDYILYKTYADKYNKPIIFLCNLKRKDMDDLKNFYMHGLYEPTSVLSKERDYLIMELSLKVNCKGYPIEIIKLISGRERRTGKGSLSIMFLEEEIIPVLREVLYKVSKDEGILYIYGISSELSEDTNAISRAKFYCRNGFVMSNSHFYKYLKSS